MRPNLNIIDYIRAVELFINCDKDKINNETFNVGYQNLKIKEIINPDSSPGFVAKFDQYVLDATTDHMLSLFKAKVKNIASNTNSINKEG